MFSFIKRPYDESRRDEERVAIVGSAEEGIRINRTNNNGSSMVLVWIYLAFWYLVIYGVKHLKDCPAENKVAISLIAVGSIGLLIKIVRYLFECQNGFGLEEVPKNKTFYLCINVLLAIFCISLLISCLTRHNVCSTESTVANSFMVIGSLGFLMKTVSCPYNWDEDFNIQGVPRNKALVCMNSLLNFILICWFIALCYWSFKMKPDLKAEDHDKPNYCALEFYLITFWGSIVGLAVLGARFVYTCSTDVFCSATREA